MKNVLLKVAVILVSTTLVSFTAHAQAGTAGGGGGGTIQSKFIARSVEIIQMLNDMPDTVKAKLSFDPTDVEAILDLNPIQPLCAIDPLQLQEMKNQGRWAEVRPDQPKIIYLDCKNHLENDWMAKLSSDEDSDVMLVLHENLRVVNGVEGKGESQEDDYHQSKSYLGAIANFRKIEHDVLYTLFTSPIGITKCRIDETQESPQENFYLIVDNNAVWSKNYNEVLCHLTGEGCFDGMSTPTDEGTIIKDFFSEYPDNRRLRNTLFKYARQYGCFTSDLKVVPFGSQNTQ